MKTLSAKILVGVIAVLALVGCDKKKSNNNLGYNQYNQRYYMDQSGTCRDRQTQQQVQPNLCYNNQGGNYNGGQYQIDPWSGYCMDSQTRQPVPYEYCQGGTWNGGGGGTWNGGYQQGQYCYGSYYTQWGGYMYCTTGWSGGSSCSGLTLYNMQGQMVYCQ